MVTLDGVKNLGNLLYNLLYKGSLVGALVSSGL